MINKKQFIFSQRIALFFICGQFLLKLFHFSSLATGISTLFVIFHGWALLLLLVSLILYYFLLTSIFYLACRILNYTFNLIYH